MGESRKIFDAEDWILRGETAIASARVAASRGWHIASRVLRGAYWVGIRRELMEQLGEATYQQTVSGKTTERVATLVDQIKEISDRIAHQESLILQNRFHQGRQHVGMD